MAGSMILDVTYGIDVKSADDYYVRIAERSMEAIGQALNPTAVIIDKWPIRAFWNLRYKT
jgi:hypothetical protein